MKSPMDETSDDDIVSSADADDFSRMLCVCCREKILKKEKMRKRRVKQEKCEKKTLVGLVRFYYCLFFCLCIGWIRSLVWCRLFERFVRLRRPILA